MSSDITKKLHRAALEPARVFGRRDFDPDDTRPVLHYAWGQGDDIREFYSPHFPQWMFEGNFLGDDCSVLNRAIDRYGWEEAPVTAAWWEFAEFLFDPAIGVPFELPDAVYRQMTNGAIVPFFQVSDVDYVAATPVAYALRRWGDITVTQAGKFVRVLHEGRVVGAIRLQDGSHLTVVGE